MAASKLAQMTCAPCTAKTPPVKAERAAKLMAQIPQWKLSRGKLRRTIRFEDFLTLMAFVNELAELAEEMQHHPDFKVSFARLDLELHTHSIKGLSLNDFVLAARIDDLLGERD